MIESRHLYSLCAIVLSKQKRRMDGFKDRCLRSILSIRIIRMYSQCIHSFFPSGVSKGEMLQEGHHKPASTLLVERKPLARLGKAMSAWPSFATASFSPGSLLQEQKFYLWHFQVLAACKTYWKLYAIEGHWHQWVLLQSCKLVGEGLTMPFRSLKHGSVLWSRLVAKTCRLKFAIFLPHSHRPDPLCGVMGRGSLCSFCIDYLVLAPIPLSQSLGWNLLDVLHWQKC